MQFERLTLKPLTPGAVITSESSAGKIFVPQSLGRKAEVVIEEELPPPPPTFSEAELQAAREEGYRKGFNDGEKKGLTFAESEVAMVDKQIHELMQPIADKVISLFSHYDQFIKHQKEQLPLLAFAIAKKVAGESLAENAMASVKSVAMQCIERMLGEPELHIYVHPSLSDTLEHKLAQHFAGSHEPGDVLIHKDEALTVSACRIEWKHGGLHFDPATILAELERTAAGVAAAAVHTHETITPDNIRDLEISETTREASHAVDVAVEAALSNIIGQNGLSMDESDSSETQISDNHKE